MSRNNHNYGRLYTWNLPSRSGSQLRERELDSSTGSYNAYLNQNLRSGSVQNHNNDLSHIKIDDLLNRNRVKNEAKEPLFAQNEPHFGFKSNSVRNLNSEHNVNSEFINKAFKMDELLRLRDQISKLENENKLLKQDLEVREKDIFTLNEKVAYLETENGNLKQQHSEELLKKDKIIQKLK